MDIESEINEIGKLLGEANLLAAVRSEVSKAVKNAVVVGGRYCREGGSHDVVIKSEFYDLIARRIRKSGLDLDVEKIADGILGVSKSRRGKDG